MAETPDQMRARIEEAERNRTLRIATNAVVASRAIGRILDTPGALDPQERDLLETAQGVVLGFVR